MIRLINLTLLILLALLALDTRSDSQYAAQPQTQPSEHVADEVIVRFRDGVDESRKDLARFRVFGSRKKAFRTVRGLEVIKLPPNVSVEEAIDLYEQDPNVLYAEPNYILRLTAKPELTATPNDPSFGSLYGLTKINAPAAWNVTTGSHNVVVAILDTGTDYNHEDLAANIFNNPTECTPDGIDNDSNGYIDDCHGINVAYGTSDPMDDNSHGTHVAGTIGAVGNNGIGVVGVNWNVKILTCKFFDAGGSATTEGAIECLDYVKTMKDDGINIVATSNSWGGGDHSQALYDAINVQRQSGILFITAAGNGNIFGVGQNNDTAPFYPCTYYLPNIICVAATTNTDAKASFSNYGKRTVHVGAPGNNILSTFPENTYGSSSGTSMATPHVSGVVALLKAQNSNRDWRTLKNLILAGGDTVNSMANTITGKRINVNGAMTCSNKVIQTRVQPVANTISASPGVPVDLGYLNLNCATPNGNVSVSVSPGNSSVTLQDNGAGADQAAGDGIYSGEWTPTATGTYTLTFPGNDKVTVNVANPTISVTPSSLDFGGVTVGRSVDKTFTVKNTGGGILEGTATTSAPYSIVSGGTYNLNGGQSQPVVVRFSPTALGTFLGNVNFTGGNEASGSVSGTGLAPANITLAYLGDLRDRVGQGDFALSADNSLDRTFSVKLVSGSGNRTVTKLVLTCCGSVGLWDTVAGNGYWVLGAASSLDSPLYNNSANASVNFAVVDGGSFNIFASGAAGPGESYTLTATFSDGTTATASVTTPVPPPPTPANITLAYLGDLRDRVGQGDFALSADNSLDRTFSVKLVSGSGNRTVTKLVLTCCGSVGLWDTVAGNGYWVLGAASSLDSPLYNNSANASVNFAVVDGGSFNIFASGAAGPGESYTLTATFSDGTTATASVTTPVPPPPTPANITLAYLGDLRDRVGQGDFALSADNSLDRTFSVKLVSGSGNRTVTKLVLTCCGSVGLWDTVAGNGYWVLGAASSLDSPLYNNSANASVNFAVVDGGSFNIFASGAAGPGESYTLTATFSDGTTATASVTTPVPPPPTPANITLAYLGDLRDRVGQGDFALSADNSLDRTFSVKLVSGSGNRTVTKLVLTCCGSVGLWDTVAGNGYWVLGAASSLDSPLYNNSANASVNFAVVDGGSFNIFASGAAGPGESYTLTATFSDGTTATASASTSTL